MTLGDPNPTNHPNFCIFRRLSYERSDFKFGTQVGYITSYQTKKKSPPKEAWLWSCDPFNFLFPPKISP